MECLKRTTYTHDHIEWFCDIASVRRYYKRSNLEDKRIRENIASKKKKMRRKIECKNDAEKDSEKEMRNQIAAFMAKNIL